jgi:hypothetical protein
VCHILDDREFLDCWVEYAAHVKNVLSRQDRKTDVNDTLWLAERLAHGPIRRRAMFKGCKGHSGTPTSIGLGLSGA